MWLLGATLHNHNWGLLLWSEAAGLGAGADANTDANADDDWGQNPEEEDCHNTSSGGTSTSGGNGGNVVPIFVREIIEGIEISPVFVVPLGLGVHNAGSNGEEGDEQLVHVFILI